MKNDVHHEDILSGAVRMVADIFEKSTQGMYLYLDDPHTTFNRRLLDMLGYESDKDVLADGVPMLEKLVDRKSQPALVKAFQRAMEHMAGSYVPITWKTKSGKAVDTSVILVPMEYDGHLLALHFIEAKQR